ncbi:Phosphoenolpyruvate carboxykinase [ATP], partial [hydrothermal vent metagenome]
MDNKQIAKHSLEEYGIRNATTHWDLPPQKLTKICIENSLGRIADTGALAVDTGEFTGRSPKDRFIVKDDITKDTVWWDGNINIPFDADKFDKLYDKVTDYLSGKELYARDAFACADERYSMNIRIITELPWVNLFAYNMFIRPNEKQLKTFSPEWTILQAPS